MPTAIKRPGLLSTSEAAKLARVSRQTIHLWTRLGYRPCDLGPLTSQKVGAHVYVTKADLMAFLKAIGRR